MKIGDLAKVTGTQVQTIRHYEREGLLPDAKRTKSNYRIYSDAHVLRLSFIRHCRSLDMALGEIRMLLRFKDAPAKNCEEVNALLDEHIEHVSTRIKELRHLQAELNALRSQCSAARDAATCGILTGLDKAAREREVGDESKPRSNHIQGAHALAPARGPRPQKGLVRRST
jgi:Cd(II)/Pb(II)-responsive transcriptional regulator